MKNLLTLLLVLVLVTLTTAQESKFSAGFGATTVYPVGEFSDNFASVGYGGKLNFFFGLNPNLDLSVALGYWTVAGDYPESVVTLDDENGSYSNIPINVGLRYIFGQSSTKPYLSAGIGWNFVSTTTPEYRDTHAGGKVYQSTSHSESAFGYFAGAGVIVETSETFYLDFNANYNSISTSGNSTGFVNFDIGANWRFLGD